MEAGEARRDDLLPYVKQLLQLNSDIAASRFLHRHQWGPSWRGPITAGALMNSIASLSVAFSSVHQLRVCLQQCEAASNIRVKLDFGQGHQTFWMSPGFDGSSQMSPLTDLLSDDSNSVHSDDAASHSSDESDINSQGEHDGSSPPGADDQGERNDPASQESSTPAKPSLDFEYASCRNAVAITILPTADATVPRIVMPVGSLRTRIGSEIGPGDETPFLLAKDMQGGAQDFVLLFSLSPVVYYDEFKDADENGDPPEVAQEDRKAYLSGIGREVSSMKLHLPKVREKSGWTFTADVEGVHDQGYRMSPVVLVGEKVGALDGEQTTAWLEALRMRYK